MLPTTQSIVYLVLALLGGDMQRRVHVFGGVVDFAAVLQQQHHDVDVAESRGYVQRGLLFARPRIHLGAVPQEDSNDVSLLKKR